MRDPSGLLEGFRGGGAVECADRTTAAQIAGRWRSRWRDPAGSGDRRQGDSNGLRRRCFFGLRAWMGLGGCGGEGTKKPRRKWWDEKKPWTQSYQLRH
uniref:Uncharacterized protein n=1 Tax=Aegilops tauschii subsp. strangulata TaxID=200361 RepID=A0A453HWP9_AEGTS